MVKVQNVQNIGLDIGRGFVKAFSTYEGKDYSLTFKSVASLRGFRMDTSKLAKEEKLAYKVEGIDSEFFVGTLAEKEGYSPIKNSDDSKVSLIAEKLLLGALHQIAKSEDVRINLGVPNRQFTAEVRKEIKEKYKGKKYKIINTFTKEEKEIKIIDIDIFKESDSALMYYLSANPNKIPKGKNHIMINSGFRTTEIAYYTEDLQYNSRNSFSIELGTQNVLDYCKSVLEEQGIYKDLQEIDSSNKYDQLKEMIFRSVTEGIEQEIKTRIKDLKELNVFFSGGTALNLKNITIDHILIDNPQMATAKGLFMILDNMVKAKGDKSNGKKKQ